MNNICVNPIGLAKFRHQLWVEHIEILDEFVYDGSTLFVLKDDYLCMYSMLNLLKIRKFSVLLLYYEGNKRLHLRLLDEDEI